MRSDRLKAEITYSEKLFVSSFALAATIFGYLFTQWDTLSSGQAFVALLGVFVFGAYAGIVYYSINDLLEELDNAE